MCCMNAQLHIYVCVCVPNACMFVVRVNPGEIVLATSGGRGLFLVAGADATGNPSAGYHLFDDDRSFAGIVGVFFQILELRV
jgi:hypothetical protein